MVSNTFSRLDRLIIGADKALRSISRNTQSPKRRSPSSELPPNELTSADRQHSAGLMRVNHSGEVCAQALYQGQALTAKLNRVRADMETASDEEMDHLSWCDERLTQLNSRPSVLNPLWYTMSFTLGAAAGLAGDKISLGFVAATEEQVSEHLRAHLKKLPDDDHASKAIVTQMLEDEEKHAQMALKAGGHQFPKPIKALMSCVSKAMTKSSYHI